jgi:addiction module HigA family antidote
MAHAPIHPGEHLAGQLEALNMSTAALAGKLAVPTNRVTEILSGKRSIAGDRTLRLGHFFGTSADFWLDLRELYELRLAEEQVSS